MAPKARWCQGQMEEGALIKEDIATYYFSFKVLFKLSAGPALVIVYFSFSTAWSSNISLEHYNITRQNNINYQPIGNVLKTNWIFLTQDPKSNVEHVYCLVMFEVFVRLLNMSLKLTTPITC